MYGNVKNNACNEHNITKNYAKIQNYTFKFKNTFKQQF